MLAEWKLEPDTGQRLVYRRGSLTPAGGILDISGFAELARLFRGDEGGRALTSLFAALLLMALAVAAWRWTDREGVYRYSVRHLSGTLLGLIAFGLAMVAFVSLGDLAQSRNTSVPSAVTLLAPVQQAGSALTVEVANLADKPSVLGFIRHAWPALLALAVWVFGWVMDRRGSRTVGWVFGWMLLVWAALRYPNGATVFLLVLGAFLLLQVVIPALRRLWQLPRRPLPAPPPASQSGAAPATTALLIGGMVWLSLGGGYRALAYSDGSFPLTPALSPGERENRSPVLEASEELPRSAILAGMRHEGGAGTVIALNDANRAALSPLPEGEGKGEGEQDVRSASRPWLLAQAATLPGRKARRLQIGDTAGSKSALSSKEAPLAESVTQDIRIEDKFALATAQIRWQAEKGEMLPLLFEPTVLTHIDYPTDALDLVQAPAGSRSAQQLLDRKRVV